MLEDDILENEENNQEEPIITRERGLELLKYLNKYQGRKVNSDIFLSILPHDILCINLKYLHDCGYIIFYGKRSQDGIWNLGDAEITSKGISYFEENGGLYKEANTISIKMDLSELRSILEEAILNSNEDKTITQKALDAIKNAPISVLQDLAKRFFLQGVKAIPHIAQQILSLYFH